MTQDNKNFGRMAVWFDVTKIKKIANTYYIQAGVHLLALFLIMFLINLIFPNLFLKDEFFFKYVCEISHLFSSTSTVELNGETYKSTDFLEAYKYIIFVFLLKFTFVSLGAYLPAGFFINKKIDKLIKARAKHYDTKLLSGTTILEDDEFIDKYNSLGLNNRDGIFISEIYKLTEVTEDDKDRRSN